MRIIEDRRHFWRRFPVFGLAVAGLAGFAVSAPRAAAPEDAPVLLASRYGGSDLSGGVSSWPPRGTPNSGVAQPLPWGGDDLAPIPVSWPSRPPAVPPPGVQAAQNGGTDAQGRPGIVSEIRAGLLAHDVGFFDSGREDGVDPSLEVYFTSPALLEVLWSPRPHLGIAVNTAGDTSQVYGGLTWDWPFWKPFFIEGSLGLALHDGKLDSSDPGRKALGCRVLFRESVALGVRFHPRQAITIQFAHISNADLCTENAGLNTVGIQYAISF